MNVKCSFNHEIKTATAIMTFVLAMLKNPEAQRRAQQEIDQVVGQDRLPTFEDEHKLPYTQAICVEVLRYEKKQYLMSYARIDFS